MPPRLLYRASREAIRLREALSFPQLSRPLTLSRQSENLLPMLQVKSRSVSMWNRSTRSSPNSSRTTKPGSPIPMEIFLIGSKSTTPTPSPSTLADGISATILSIHKNTPSLPSKSTPTITSFSLPRTKKERLTSNSQKAVTTSPSPIPMEMSSRNFRPLILRNSTTFLTGRVMTTASPISFPLPAIPTGLLEANWDLPSNP